jgi:hypothetical protein
MSHCLRGEKLATFWLALSSENQSRSLGFRLGKRGEYMNESTVAAELYDARSRYEAKHGPLHPILRDLSPTLLLSLVQSALSGGVELKASTVEEALSTVDDRVRFLMEQVKA